MNKLQKLFKLEDETWSLNSISFCLKEDLERFRKGKLLKGDIKVGQYFEWEPDKPNAAEACMVTKITNEKIFTIGNRFGDKEVGNDISRFREAAVRSLRKYLHKFLILNIPVIIENCSDAIDIKNNKLVVYWQIGEKYSGNFASGFSNSIHEVVNEILQTAKKHYLDAPCFKEEK